MTRHRKKLNQLTAAKQHHEARRGSALVVALGILAVMSIMGFAFVSTMNIEYVASKSVGDRTILDLLGTWALNNVCDHLKYETWQGLAWTPVDYSGESWCTGDDFEYDVNDKVIFPTEGVIVGDFPGRGKIAIAHVIHDSAGMINVNMFKGYDEDNNEKVFSETEQAIKKMLTHLVTNTGIEIDSPASFVTTIMAGAPYANKEEMWNYLSEHLTGWDDVSNEAKDRLKYCITTYSWVDPTTGPFSVLDDRAAILNLVPRAPVNINTAKVEVIESVLFPIEVNVPASAIPGSSSPVFVDFSKPPPGGGTDSMARLLAAWFVGKQKTSPIASWHEFNKALCEVLKEYCPADKTRAAAYRAALNAHCNPNYIPAWMPRDSCVPPNAGKENVTSGTTEFCFSSFGRFEIEMETRLVNKLFDGKVVAADNMLAASRYSAAVQLGEPTRFTANQHFGIEDKVATAADPSKGMNYSPDRPGKEGTFKSATGGSYRSHNVIGMLGANVNNGTGMSLGRTLPPGAPSMKVVEKGGSNSMSFKKFVEISPFEGGACYCDGLYLDKHYLEVNAEQTLGTQATISMWVRIGPKFLDQPGGGTVVLINHPNGAQHGLKATITLMSVSEAPKLYALTISAALTAQEKDGSGGVSGTRTITATASSPQVIWFEKTAREKWHYLTFAYKIEGATAEVKAFVDGQSTGKPASGENESGWLLPVSPGSYFPIGPKTATPKFDCTIDGLRISGVYPTGSTDPNLSLLKRRYQRTTTFEMREMGLTPSFTLECPVFTPDAFNPGGEPIYLEVPDGAMFGAVSWTEYIPLDIDSNPPAECTSSGKDAANVGISGVQIFTLGAFTGMTYVPESPSSSKINQSIGGAGTQKEKDDEPDWKDCIDPRPGIYSVRSPLGRRGEGEPIMKIVDEDGNDYATSNDTLPVLQTTYTRSSSPNAGVEAAICDVVVGENPSLVFFNIRIEADNCTVDKDVGFMAKGSHGAPKVDDVTFFWMTAPKILFWSEDVK